MATKTANILARDEMDTAAFDALMGESLVQAKAGQGLPLDEAFCLLRKGVYMDYGRGLRQTRPTATVGANGDA